MARPPRSDAPRAPLPAGFFTLWSTVAIDLIGFGIVLPILPQYAERFGATPATVGLLVASFSLAQLVFAPIWGRLSDRIGRKPVLVVSLFGTAIGSLLTGLAGSLWLLFLGRIVDGASGASVSVAQASAADLASPAERPRLMGLLGAAFGLGFVVGPAIGALGALAGIHVPFFLAAGLAFVNAVVAIWRLPETAPAVAPATATAATAGPPGPGLGEGAPSSPVADGSASDAVLADEAGLDAERIAAAPALDGPGLVEPAHLGEPAADGAQVPAIRRLIVVAFVAMVAFAGFEATFALLGDRRFGFELAATGAVFAVIGLALVGVQGGLVGPVTTALGERTVLRLGLIANAGGLALLAVDGGWLTLVPALALLVVGQGLLAPTLSSAVAGRAGGERGRWLGWQQSAGGLARVLGPITAGVLFEQVGVGSPYLVGAVLVLVALALVP